MPCGMEDVTKFVSQVRSQAGAFGGGGVLEFVLWPFVAFVRVGYVPFWNCSLGSSEKNNAVTMLWERIGFRAKWGWGMVPRRSQIVGFP